MTSLSLDNPHLPQAEVDPEPLYALKGPETLWLQWDSYWGTKPLQVQFGITALSRLSQIHLVSLFEVFLNVKWEFMRVLQRSTISCRLWCNMHMHMLGLGRLEDPCLDYIRRACNAPPSALEVLMCTLQANCPDVEVLIK